jgi:hypothetical protein
MPRKIVLVFPVLLLILALVGAACTSHPSGEEDSEQTAESYVENSATFRFDGILDTFQLTNTVQLSTGWQFTFRFDCSHAGYGNRAGQNLAQVITPHTAVITVSNGQVTTAVIDSIWDMMNQRMMGM